MDLGSLASVGGSTWTPLRLNPLAWYRADVAWVDLGTGNEMAQLKNAAAPTNTMALIGPGVITPQFAPSGWNGNHGTVEMVGTNGMIFTTGSPVGAYGTGTDIPVSVIVTGTTTDPSLDNTYCSWDDPDGATTSLMQIRSDNVDPDATMRCTRTDSSGSTVSRTATRKLVAGAHRRMVWSFTGAAIEFYLDGTIDSSAAMDVGALSFTRFRVGTGPGASDAWGGSLREIIVVPRPLLASEVLAHYKWSLAKEGP